MIAALLIFALGDNLTDALSIHIYQESERLESRRAFAATVVNFMTRVAICASFLAFVAAPKCYAVGLSLLCTRPVKATCRITGVREIVGPLICKLMGKRDDGHRAFRSGAAPALDDG